MNNIPEHLKFTRTHEWLESDADDVIVGITDHAQQLLGDMVFVELPQVGATVAVGDELGVLESVKAASEFYAPVSGVVTAVNQAVCEEPALVNREPYQAGWLVKIKPTHAEELGQLLDASHYHHEILGEH